MNALAGNTFRMHPGGLNEGVEGAFWGFSFFLCQFWSFLFTTLVDSPAGFSFIWKVSFLNLIINCCKWSKSCSQLFIMLCACVCVYMCVWACVCVDSWKCLFVIEFRWTPSVSCLFARLWTDWLTGHCLENLENPNIQCRQNFCVKP